MEPAIRWCRMWEVQGAAASSEAEGWHEGRARQAPAKVCVQGREADKPL